MYLQGLLVSALLFSSGCLGSLQMGNTRIPEIEEKQLSDKTLAKTVQPEGIVVFRGKDELPKGIFLYQDREQGKLRIKLFAVPDYPTADSPNLVLAAMATKRPSYARQADALLHEYKRRASDMGANALVLSSSGIVFAILASSAEPTIEPPAVKDLAKRERAKLAGYRPVGKARRVEMGRAELGLKATKARCYAMTVVLEEKARLNTAAQNALYLSLRSGDALLGNRSYGGPKEDIENPEGLAIEAPRHGRFMHMRSFANELGCASGATSAAIELWTQGKSTALGDGHFSVQLFEKKISATKLAEMLSKRRRRLAAAAAEQQRHHELRAQEQEQEQERQRQQQRQRDRQASDARRSSSAPTSSASTYFSMSLKNECPRTVKLFIGKKPRFGSGTSTSVSSNSIGSYSGSAGQTYWIVDDSGNGLSSFTVSPGRHNMRILPSCTGFATR